MLIKIISGGQTGADTAGIIAAKELGFQTGGCMPRGFLRLDGPHPEFKDLYGMHEHTSSKYPPRTEENVYNSDGTVRFAFNFNSPGELCTLKAIKKFDRPYFDVNLRDSIPVPIEEFIGWLIIHNISVLNVAGNATSYLHGKVDIVSARVYTYMKLSLQDYLAKNYLK